MLCINHTYRDAWFNLAAEEYLLKNFSEDIFMLWQNEPSVIIGKHQNVWDEVNIDFVKENEIKVVRRFSGGGAVYHDPGNLNLTFIENGSRLSTDKFTRQIIDFLKSEGTHVIADKRQGLVIDGLKISGSAQCIHKNRIMHHATLLFCSNLDYLTTALQSHPEEKSKRPFSSRPVYVKSVRSPVTNISDHLPVPVSIDKFKQSLMNYFCTPGGDHCSYRFTENDLNAIRQLRESKYMTESWNYTGSVEDTTRIDCLHS